jgi:hypothetical protein
MSTDYPRMLFHRTKDPVTVHSREEEDALGRGWSRKIWPPEEEPETESQPEPELDPEPDEEEEEVSPVVPRPPVKPPIRRPAADKPARRKR